MAESIVTFFLEKLTDLLSQEAFLLSRVEEQVKLLSNELEWMRLFLKDADAKRRYDPRIKLWVSQIRDVTYDAEDVIDRFMFEMNHQQQGSLKCLKFLKLRFVHKLESRIREINIKIEKIMANKSRYGVETLPAASSSNEVVPHKERRAPIVEEVNVVGIQEDAKSVKQNLLNGEMRRAVVSIVGMGGLGKTTLAKKVYNDNDVRQCFDCHAWIYVSQEYTIRELLLGVAVCVRILSEEERSKMNESDLGNSLRDYLTTRKYLIVMDDMWRNEAWDRLGLYFPDSVNGSRVLITSRNKEIGLYADPQTIPHELSFLTEEESWELFLKKIFLAGSANAVCPENWKKDSEIRTDKLIRLWVAEGFIQRRGEEIAEDVTEDHLQELVHRSMIQVAARSFDGRVMSCRMHDLLRDLAISEAKDTNFFEGYESIDSTSPERILTMPHLMPFSDHTYLYHLSLRGRLERFPDEIEFYPPNLVSLELECWNIEQDPMVTLEKLPNLRFLRLFHCSSMLKKMVCTSGGFQQLETLKLWNLKELKELIAEEGAMPDLKDLVIDTCPKMKRLSHGLLQRKNLQNLSLYDLSPELMDELSRIEGDLEKICLATSIHGWRRTAS
ncbi:putative disease resistance RPP13-like protein 3 [Vitis vinifera]|uniref:putative disease resistance RPP13-like protein 3 n=1 Tax=Vitis vinifera TaxID=29760 RepID=UPI00053F35C0|nr:putative disease resistance RPP13-like protein 3 [Vitis vinifera]|eukprot:XP_010661280.1 PREDICTED: putative disease resistance RPP13-like protein 3 [Vitis vinifera]